MNRNLMAWLDSISSIEEERIIGELPSLMADENLLLDMIPHFDVIRALHKGQRRITASGKCPYFHHPVKVALIAWAAANGNNINGPGKRNIFLASLYHDVIEDTAMTMMGLEAILPEAVSGMVLALTKNGDKSDESLVLYGDQLRRKEHGQAVRTIKLADILSNLHAMQYRPDRLPAWRNEKRALLPYLKHSFSPELFALAEEKLGGETIRDLSFL